jgi:hypothetical protein
MPDGNRRETGAREPKQKRGIDATDSVSQEAAGNHPPPSGAGNTEPTDDTAPGQSGAAKSRRPDR